MSCGLRVLVTLVACVVGLVSVGIMPKNSEWRWSVAVLGRVALGALGQTAFAVALLELWFPRG